MYHAVLAAVFVGIAALSVRAQEVQVVEFPIAALGGDWVSSGCAGEDLSATVSGQSLAFSFIDTTGLSTVQLILRIHWRHHKAHACSLALNGIYVGLLDQPQLEFPCRADRFYPTIHVINVPAGAYAANALNKFVLTMKDESGGSVGICDATEAAFALRCEVRAVPVALEGGAQIVEAGLEDFEGDWVLESSGAFSELGASIPGQELRFSFEDRTGYAMVMLRLEIFWRHHAGRTCAVSLNGVSLGFLDRPTETLVRRDGVFYPTAQLFRVAADVFRSKGLNEVVLTFVDDNGGAVAVCEEPGSGAALRVYVFEDRPTAPPPPPISTMPALPQGIQLIDLTTGIVLLPGVVINSQNLQIMAVLTDADGDYSALEIEIRNMEASFTGTPYLQTLPVSSGGRIFVLLPALGPGVWQIQIRAIDQKGSTSGWTTLETAIEVIDNAAGRQVRGVERLTLVLPPDYGALAGSNGDSSSGGACSAGSVPDARLVPILLGLLFAIACLKRST